MSQSHKRRPNMPAQRLSDPALPLSIALAYLLVRVFPQNAHKPTAKVYSDGFVTAILALVSQEVFEVSCT
jgi:anaphase-promoting complex subunit 5